jgi:hypothetical protein
MLSWELRLVAFALGVELPPTMAAAADVCRVGSAVHPLDGFILALLQRLPAHTETRGVGARVFLCLAIGLPSAP